MNASMAVTVQMDIVKTLRDLSDVLVTMVINCLQQRISVKVGMFLKLTIVHLSQNCCATVTQSMLQNII